MKGDTMSTPLIVISKFCVRSGRLEDLKRYYRKILDIVEANEPQVIAFHGFLNENATEMTSIQVHPDAASLDLHMQVLRDNWDESFGEYSQMMDVVSVEYYGTPPESALEMDGQGDWSLSVQPVHIHGFTRGLKGQDSATAIDNH
jgi:hypothetical protein